MPDDPIAGTPTDIAPGKADATAIPAVAEPVLRNATPVRPRTTVHLTGCAAMMISLAVVFTVAIVAAAFLLWDKLPSGRLAQTQVVELAGQGMQGAADTVREVLQPRVSIATQVISTGVSLLAKEGKLVVLTRSLPITVEKRSEKRVLWDSLSLGETVARVTVRDNKVQHVVYLGQLRPEDLVYDATANRLLVTIPPPEVDPAMLAIASDPEQWSVQTEVGWGRLRSWSGDALTEAAKAELDDVLLTTARMDAAADEVARTQAREQVAALLRNSLAPLAPGLDVEVTFLERLG